MYIGGYLDTSYLTYDQMQTVFEVFASDDRDLINGRDFWIDKGIIYLTVNSASDDTLAAIDGALRALKANGIEVCGEVSVEYIESFISSYLMLKVDCCLPSILAGDEGIYRGREPLENAMKHHLEAQGCYDVLIGLIECEGNFASFETTYKWRLNAWDKEVKSTKYAAKSDDGELHFAPC